MYMVCVFIEKKGKSAEPSIIKVCHQELAAYMYVGTVGTSTSITKPLCMATSAACQEWKVVDY